MGFGYPAIPNAGATDQPTVNPLVEDVREDMRHRNVLIAGRDHDIRLTPQTAHIAVLVELVPFGQHEAFHRWEIFPNDRGYRDDVNTLSEHVHGMTLNGRSLASPTDLTALEDELTFMLECSRHNYLDQRPFTG